MVELEKVMGVVEVVAGVGSWHFSSTVRSHRSLCQYLFMGPNSLLFSGYSADR